MNTVTQSLPVGTTYRALVNCSSNDTDGYGVSVPDVSARLGHQNGEHVLQEFWTLPYILYVLPDEGTMALPGRDL